MPDIVVRLGELDLGRIEPRAARAGAMRGYASRDGASVVCVYR